MRALSTVSRSIFGWVSAAVAVAVIAVSASVLAAPGKAYADTASHIEATGEIHVLVDGAGNASIPNVTLKNTGSAAAYVTGCTAPAELTGWTCDAVGKRIEPGQSVQASWSGQVSAETAAKLGCEAYFAGTLTYSYVDAELKATVAIDNQDPCVGDTVTASVSGLNVSDDQVTYQWYRVKDGVETTIDGAVQPAYTVADADAGCTLLCKLLSSDSICTGSVSSDATHEVKRLEAFAVYSADDGSLNFYKRSGVPAAGEQFEGKTATAVYTGIETETYRSEMSAPWSGVRGTIKTVTVADEGIAPVSTAMWFYHMSHLESADISKLDTSNVTSMSYMFGQCNALTALDLSSFDTRNVTDLSKMFYFCFRLTALDLSSFDTRNVTDLSGMLYACGSLTALDLSSFDTRNVTDLSGMFWSCSKLQEVTFGENWKWVGTNGYLPVPSDSYITGADGKWYDTDGNGYAPADIPSNKAMTYYASKDLVPGITISGNAEVGETLTATVNNLSEEEITGYQWYTVDDSSNETAIANATAHTYTVTANEVGKKILCKAFYKNGSATKNVKTTPTDNVTPQKTAYAVYSADDNSLNFYKRTSVPSAGEQFEGKTATKVYKGIEDTNRSVPWSNYKRSIKTATVVDDGIQPKSTVQWFYNFSNMTQCDMSKLDTSNLTDMNSMFYNCSKLTSVGDLSSWNTPKVTTIYGMFDRCSALTSVGDLSGWNTSKVTNMNSMFSSCSSLTTLDLSSWNTSKVASMNYMFDRCSNLTTLDLSGWNISSVTTMQSMFDRCSSLTTLDLSSWNTSNLTRAPMMFSSCSALTSVGDLSGWNTSKVTDMSYMFNGCKSLTSVGDLSSWNTSNLASASCMFYNCSKLTSVGDLSSWNTANVTDTSIMFSGCSALTSVGDLSGWNTSKVTGMGLMFYGCSALTSVGDLSGWNTSKVIGMNSMFGACSKLTSVGDLSNWNTSNVASMNYMFTGCSALTSVGDLSGWNTSKVASMNYMFSGCSSLTTLGDLSSWDTSNVTRMDYMFNDCSALTSVGDLSGWNTSKVASMNYMFSGCSSLTTLGDLSSWDTSNVTRMDYMFNGCSRLSADCSNWDVSKVTNHYNFNKNATGVTVPLAWQTSSDEGVEDSAIAPLCEEQGNGDALSVPSKNYADEASSKADGEPPVDTATKGNADTPAGDADAKEEETPGDIANDNVATV